jgi:hypothetical protein
VQFTATLLQWLGGNCRWLSACFEADFPMSVVTKGLIFRFPAAAQSCPVHTPLLIDIQ